MNVPRIQKFVAIVNVSTLMVAITVKLRVQLDFSEVETVFVQVGICKSVHVSNRYYAP